MDFIISLVLTLATIIGGLRMVLAGLVTIAKVTPSQRDDIYLGKAARVIAELEYWLDKLSAGLPKSQARDDPK